MTLADVLFSIMYGVKCSLVGQTLALVTCNDSGGRKTRVRRSKEERKAMVEFFIKKYQSLNGGNFPSLNLTHKEVGGSFYTVREIVREIIQENRVLGPARLSSEGQKFDAISVQYPLGSISAEPQSDLFHVDNENQDVPNHQSNVSCVTEHNLAELSASLELDSPPWDEVGNLGMTLNGNGQFSSDFGLEDGQFDSGSQTEESNKVLCTESTGTETTETDTQPESIGACMNELINPTADIVVETFPLGLVAEDTVMLDDPLDSSADLSATVEELGREESGSGKGSSVLGCMDSIGDPSGVLNQRAVGDPAPPLSETGQTVANLPHKSHKIPDPSTTVEARAITQDSKDFVVTVPHVDVTAKTTEQSPGTGGIESKSHLDGALIRNLDGLNSHSASKESTSKKPVVLLQEVHIQNDDATLTGSKPTLDRIHLESWKGASKKSSQPETNALLAFFKAFVTAFVKLWSE